MPSTLVAEDAAPVTRTARSTPAAVPLPTHAEKSDNTPAPAGGTSSPPVLVGSTAGDARPTLSVKAPVFTPAVPDHAPVTPIVATASQTKAETGDGVTGKAGTDGSGGFISSAEVKRTLAEAAKGSARLVPLSRRGSTPLGPKFQKGDEVLKWVGSEVDGRYDLCDIDEVRCTKGVTEYKLFSAESPFTLRGEWTGEWGMISEPYFPFPRNLRHTLPRPDFSKR